ncbi:hypothetical protein K4K61_005117 [Colletotrichum sp. SAR11_59]|nr:hypothetical protein K4K61_005117 [Colletotrichum sp. SAR11_59]
MSIRRIAIAGATGNLGPAILTALRSSKQFDVTVLTRTGSSHQFPTDVTVKYVDYDNPALLAEAVHVQKALVDASVAAGVKRFLPSEFGSSTENPKVQAIPIFGAKLQLQEYLRASVYVKDLDVTQRQIISAAKEIDPSGSWTIQESQTAIEEQEALSGLKYGQVDIGVISKFLFRAIFGEGYGGKFDKVDNELLGVEGLDANGLRDVVRPVLNA